MEGILFETLEIGVGVVFTAFAILCLAAGGALLAGMGEAERTGARLTWAEWPLYEKVEAAPPEIVRLAA